MIFLATGYFSLRGGGCYAFAHPMNSSALNQVSLVLLYTLVESLSLE